jgi:predicted nucleic acid-binding protein
LLSDVRVGRYTLIESLSVDLERVAELVAKYDDLPLGTVDVSMIALAERLNVTTVVPLDRRDFSIVRPSHVSAWSPGVDREVAAPLETTAVTGRH